MSDNGDVLTVDLPAPEVLRRLRARVQVEGFTGAVFGEPSVRGYVGAFDGREFRIRVARPASQFYATYLLGSVDGREAGSTVTLRFGHRSAARWALWVIRVVGAVLVAGALVAGLRQPVFFVGAGFVAAGTGLLLWMYRLWADDRERLRSFALASIHSPAAQ